MGWKNNLLGIPQDINDPMAKWTDFISSYGTIDLEHLQRYARTMLDSHLELRKTA